jgi:hypothetical protein
VAHREVIAHVAHDLRTPLTALHGHLEALQAGVASPERVARHLDTALAQSDKLRRLTQQLFELATLQSLDQAPQRERFRLDELVADAVQKFELLAGPPRVGLAGAEPGAVEVLGDLHLIERALTNLIDNALRHTTGEDRVRVSVQRCDQEVAVLVQDNGPGMPEELRRRLDSGVSVRDPAVRRHAGGGMGGLGLAIAQRIAVLHGGRLHTLPAPQGGTTLRLALPLPSWPRSAAWNASRSAATRSAAWRFQPLSWIPRSGWLPFAQQCTVAQRSGGVPKSRSGWLALKRCQEGSIANGYLTLFPFSATACANLILSSWWRSPLQRLWACPPRLRRRPRRRRTSAWRTC